MKGPTLSHGGETDKVDRSCRRREKDSLIDDRNGRLRAPFSLPWCGPGVVSTL